MFHTENYITENNTKVCPVTRVIEKSITPDKVTDIYESVKKEVVGQILNTYCINNTLNAVVIETYDDPNNLKRVYRYGFELNGKMYTGKLDYNWRINKCKYEDEIVKELFEIFARAVTVKLIDKSLPKMIKL